MDVRGQPGAAPASEEDYSGDHRGRDQVLTLLRRLLDVTEGRFQLELALDNLEAIVVAADMTLADVVRLNLYTTDVDELINQHFSIISGRFGDSRYVTSIVGVTPLPAQFLVMLEVTAID